MTKILFLTAAILLTQNCKGILCRDNVLTIARIENNSNKLRMDGYYYGDLVPTNSERPDIYLIYRNGIFSNAYSFNLSDAETGNVSLVYSDLQYEHKAAWGVYIINGSNIEIEYWSPRPCGAVGLLYEKGVILNDTTFKINYWKSSYNGNIENEGSPEAIFKFQEYSPKPDSIIKFIP